MELLLALPWSAFERALALSAPWSVIERALASLAPWSEESLVLGLA